MKKVFFSNFLFYFLLIISLIFFGYLRDFLFVNINGLLDKLNNKAYFNELSPKLYFINDISCRQLFIGKWILTLIFSFIYFTFCYFTIKKMFSEKKISSVDNLCSYSNFSCFISILSLWNIIS